MENNLLEPGTYTMFGISSFLANTTKTEFEIKEVERVSVDMQIAYIRGKRKLVKIKLVPGEQFIFKGWDLPIRPDTEFNVWAGNACYNFVADTIEMAKDFIENKNVLETTFPMKVKCNFKSTKFANFMDKEAVRIYPELDEN